MADDFDDFSTDMGDEFDLGLDDLDDDSSGNSSKSSKVIRGAKELLKGTASGTIRGVRNELERRFTNTKGLVDEVTSTVDDFKKLKEDLSSEIGPAVNTMKKIALQAMPAVEKVMPKKWYDSIKKRLEESIQPEETKRNMEEEYRNEMIKSSLQSIFNTQVDLQQKQTAKDDAERLIDRKLSEKHFAASQEMMGKIRTSVDTIANFITGTYTGYLKKSLELKYQQMFIARDIHKGVVAIAKLTESRLKEISENTGLPDFAKQGKMRGGGLAASRGTRNQTYSEYKSSFRRNFMENISKNIMGSVKGVTRDLLSQLDMVTSMMGMMGGEQALTPTKLLAMGLGWLGGRVVQKKLGKKLDQFSIFNDALEHKMKFGKDYMISAMQKFAERHRNTGGLLGWIADKVPVFNRRGVKNSMLEGANEAVPFDNTTRQTIVEVIPRHLERIGNLTEALQSVLAPNAKINKMTYNVHQRKLTTLEEARNDFIEKEGFGTAEQRSKDMEETMGKFRAVLMTNNNTKSNRNDARTKDLNQRFDKCKPHLKRFIINSAMAVRFFEADTIAEFAATGHTTPYIKNAFDGIPDEQKRDLAQLLIEMVRDPKTGHISGTMIDHINDNIQERMKDTNVQELMAKAGENFGQSQLFEDVVSYKKGVNNAGLLKMLDPTVAKKKTTYYNPQTGKPYTEEELKAKGLSGANRSFETEAAEGMEKTLRHLRAQEDVLKRNWKRKGGKEGDVADKLEGVLGPAAYGINGAVNDKLTTAVNWVSGKWKAAKNSITGAFDEDSLWGELYGKGKDLYDKAQAHKPHVTSVVRTGPTTFVITAKDNNWNTFNETVTVATPPKEGEIPTKHIQGACSKKKWIFDMSAEDFRYSEVTTEGGMPNVSTGPSAGAPGKPGVHIRPRASDIGSIGKFDLDSKVSLTSTIPSKLDTIIELLGGPKAESPAGASLPPPPQPKVPENLTVPGGEVSGPSVSIEADVAKLDAATAAAPSVDSRVVDLPEEKSTAERRSTRQRIKDTTGKLIETFENKEELIKYFPESMREQVGAIYDNSVKAGHSIGKFFNKLGQDIKATGVQKKIMEDLKRVTSVIPDAEQRKKYVGNILNKLATYKNVVTDSKKRKEALANIRKSMTEGLENIQKEIQEKGVGGTIKAHARAGIFGIWDKIKAGWQKFKESRIGRWILSHIPPKVKADVKKAFEQAKGDVKKGIEEAKKVLNKHNKEAEKKGEETVNPKILDAAQTVGSGDEAEYTSDDIAKSVLGDKAVTHEQAEAKAAEASTPEAKAETKTSAPSPVAPPATSPSPATPVVPDTVRSAPKQGFFSKVKGLFHRHPKEEAPGVAEAKSTSSGGSGDDKSTKGDLEFKGEPESLFHKEFRMFAQRQIADNQSIVSAVFGIPGGKRGHGILGSLLGAGGRIGGGLLGAYGRIMGAMIGAGGRLGSAALGAAGHIGKGVLIGGGKVLGGALKAAPAVGKALLAPGKWTVKGIGLGAKGIWHGTKKVGGFLKKDWQKTKDDFSRWFGRKHKGPKAEEHPEYYQDENGQWHGPDGAIVPEDQVPEQYKTAQKKESIITRVKNKVKGWFSKPDDPNKKDEEEDNPLKRKGFKGLFKSIGEGAKKVGGWVKGLFTKDKAESKDEIPKAGRKYGLDIIYNKLNDIFNLMKDEITKREEAAKKEEEAKKEAQQAEANMSAEEQKAANEKKQAEKEKEAAETKAQMDAAHAAANAPGMQAVPTAAAGAAAGGGGGEDEEEGGLMDDAVEWGKGKIKDKILGFARNKMAAKGLKLLRKTKFGRKFLKSGAGKFLNKHMTKWLAKGASGKAGGLMSKAGGIFSKVGGKAGGIFSKLGGKAGGLISKLGGKAGGLIGKVGFKGLAKAAGSALAIGEALGGAVHGFTASEESHNKFVKDMSNRSTGKVILDAINPFNIWNNMRSATATIREGVGLAKDKAAAKASAKKADEMQLKLDEKILEKFKKNGVPEDVIKEYESLKGSGDPAALKKKFELRTKYSNYGAGDKKQGETPDAKEIANKAAESVPGKEAIANAVKGGSTSSISIPETSAKALAATSDTAAECKSEFMDYVNDKFPDASQEAKEKAVAEAMNKYYFKVNATAKLGESGGKSSGGFFSKLFKRGSKLASDIIPGASIVKGISSAGSWLGKKLGFTSDLSDEERADLEKRAAAGDEEAKKKLAEHSGGFKKGMKNILGGLRSAFNKMPLGAGMKLARKLGNNIKGTAKDLIGKAANTKLGKAAIAAAKMTPAYQLAKGAIDLGKKGAGLTKDALVKLGVPEEMVDKVASKIGISTAASKQDERAVAKQNGADAYVKGKQPGAPGKPGEDPAAKASADLLQATTAGNQDVVGKLGEMVKLMKEQIVVTSDSKVATEKATSENAQKALAAANQYAKETAQKAVEASKPKPQRPPAINVGKPAMT